MLREPVSPELQPFPAMERKPARAIVAMFARWREGPLLFWTTLVPVFCFLPLPSQCCVPRWSASLSLRGPLCEALPCFPFSCLPPLSVRARSQLPCAGGRVPSGRSHYRSLTLARRPPNRNFSSLGSLGNASSSFYFILFFFAARCGDAFFSPGG